MNHENWQNHIERRAQDAEIIAFLKGESSAPLCHQDVTDLEAVDARRTEKFLREAGGKKRAPRNLGIGAMTCSPRCPKCHSLAEVIDRKCAEAANLATENKRLHEEAKRSKRQNARLVLSWKYGTILLLLCQVAAAAGWAAAHFHY